MRAHDYTKGPTRIGAWCWLILFALAHVVRAQNASPAPSAPAPQANQASDLVDLVANQIQVWDSGNERWMVLAGQAQATQGQFDLRADQIVVRITAGSQLGLGSKRIEFYAEGRAQVLGKTGFPRSVLRATLFSNHDPRPRALTEKGLRRVSGPPNNFPIWKRAFTSVPLDPGPTPPPPPARRAPAEARTRTVQVSQNGAPNRDPSLKLAIDNQDLVQAPAPAPRPNVGPPDIDLPPIEGAPSVPNLQPKPAPESPPPTVEPLPGPDDKPVPPIRQEPRPAKPADVSTAPIISGSQRITRIYARNGGPDFQFQRLPTTPEGVEIYVIRGGVNVVAEAPAPQGIVDISSDSAIIWRQSDPKHQSVIGPDGETIDPLHAPMEIYLEGNVVFRQDQRRLAGTADQKTFRANAAYYDFRTDRVISLDSEVDLFAPGLLSPLKVKSPRIEQYRPTVFGPDGKLTYGLQQLRADQAVMTGSRFPNPGYRVRTKSVDLTRVVDSTVNPITGFLNPNSRAPGAPEELTWQYDARQNFFFMGPVPTFYWPRFVGEADDFDPVLRMIGYRMNNYFGQQILADFNGFKLLGIKRPSAIDIWNVDVDYLSRRTKEFPALGSELGWFGTDLIHDIVDPYHKTRNTDPIILSDYFGYFDMWGLRDFATDVLGPGPAIITNNPKFGNVGIQRTNTPAFQQFRGRVNMRHMQYFFDQDDPENRFSELRLQVEAAYLSDRYFLEEYYKRLSETGLDEETLGYMFYQRDNTAMSVWTEANLQSWYTDTQWFPRLDYYRLGDSFLADRVTYFQHSGADYANVHTAVEVNNPHVFAFIPYDPTSNTNGSFSSGRFYTNHEVDLPLKFEYFRFVPYVQGQVVGWNNQLAGNAVGRVWGAYGARLDFQAWRAFPTVESELWNVHGFNHKVNVQFDYRNAFSNVGLNTLAIQDDLDDNEYEYVRRYFAMTNYVGGILAPQYDPRFLMLRRVLSPITGPTDVQGTIQTLQINAHQRLQTKRGPEGRRRIIDYMTLDLSTTYFPQDSQNFGKPFGQNMYNWQWFVGDRTALYSYGWFEFFNITGRPTFATTSPSQNNPNGLAVITSGIQFTRPPRSSFNLNYSVINTGPIDTSAVGVSFSYWMAPKWYATFSDSYDFGNHIPLASSLSLTRIGADWLVSLGLVVDPQRSSYQGAITIAPRASTAGRGGSPALQQLDPRYAPTQ